MTFIPQAVSQDNNSQKGIIDSKVFDINTAKLPANMVQKPPKKHKKKYTVIF